MKPGDLQVNDLIMIRSSADSSERSYPSRIEDLRENIVTLSWPTDGGIRIAIRANEILHLSYARSDAVYGRQVSVLKVIPEPIPVISVALTGPVERVQRREYVRVQAVLPVEMTLTTPLEEGQDPGIAFFQTKTLDVSAGGLSIHHQLTIPHGALYDVKLAIPKVFPPLKLLAKVIRISIQKDAYGAKIYEYGLMFLSVAERTRARLVKFAFDVQRMDMNR
jgi:c-di-GMP-binding flagellar brake protein YcgR